MAEENFDNQSFGNFSIQNTMEMGLGNAELLNDLMSSETSTSNPEDIKDLTPEDKAPKTSSPKKATTSVVPEIDEEEKKDNKVSIEDFLQTGGDEDDDEEEAPIAKVKNSTSTNDDDEEEEPEVSRFGALSNDLFKLGVFSKDEDEEDVTISTPEEFLERFNSEKKKGAIEVVNNFIGQFGEDYQQAFEAIFVKGVDPKEYFGTYNNIESFTNLDLSEENNQIAILKQALNDQGFDPEDVTTEIERLKNYGDLETVAAKHHKVLIKKEAAKLQQLEEQGQKALQQKAAIRNQYVNNVQSVLQEKLKTKEFDGIPLNPKLVGELQDFLLTDKYKTPSGETLTDFDRTILDLKRPENHEQKVKVALLLKILEKDPTLSTIQKSGISKKSNELFGEVARQVSKSGVKSNTKSQAASQSWFS